MSFYKIKSLCRFRIVRGFIKWLKKTTLINYFKENADKCVKRLCKDYSPKKIRDEKIIRDVVWGFNLFYKHEMNVIDCPILQRLRRIKQTALAYFTYPTAIHSRFEHSLGATTIAGKIIDTLNLKLSERNEPQIPEHKKYEIRLAALLHDIGHGPFSHGSEEYFKTNPIFQKLALIDPYFGDLPAGEVLTYFIVESPTLKNIWNKIKSLYKQDTKYYEALNNVNLDNIGEMILGKDVQNDEYSYLAKIINGPFDVDKLDYIQRDGYFTGLKLQVDVERLLLSLDVWRHNGDSALCVSIGGIGALEQLLFSKMVLYHSVYHHHKIRSSVYNLFSLFDYIRANGGVSNVSLNDSIEYDSHRRPFPNPFDFLLLDDNSILNLCYVNNKVNAEVEKLLNRNLYKRALVVNLWTIEDTNNMTEACYLRFLVNKEFRENIRKEIANRCGLNLDNVIIDVPDKPKFEKISLDAKVKITQKKVVDLEAVYPTRGWVTGYAQFKYNVYVFCSPEYQEKVGKAAFSVFKENGIFLKVEALELAKQNIDLIEDMQYKTLS